MMSDAKSLRASQPRPRTYSRRFLTRFRPLHVLALRARRTNLSRMKPTRFCFSTAISCWACWPRKLSLLVECLSQTLLEPQDGERVKRAGQEGAARGGGAAERDDVCGQPLGVRAQTRRVH